MKTRAHLRPGRRAIFAGFDGIQYPAVILTRPYFGLVRIRYTVPGGITEPTVMAERVLPPVTN